MQTKAFKSGNSLAVRIPKGLAIFTPSQDVIIERKGDTLVLRAVERKSLADVMDIFAQFGPDFMKDGRGPASWREQKERDFSGWHENPTAADSTVPANVLHQTRASYRIEKNAPSLDNASAVQPPNDVKIKKVQPKSSSLKAKAQRGSDAS